MLGPESFLGFDSRPRLIFGYQWLTNEIESEGGLEFWGNVFLEFDHPLLRLGECCSNCCWVIATSRPLENPLKVDFF
jgi:hypothetical protein